MKKEERNTMGATIKRLVSYMDTKSWLLILTLCLAIAGTIMEVITPKLLGNATTEIVTGLSKPTGINFTNLFQLLCWIGLLYLGVFGASFFQQRIMLVISQRISFSLRNELKKKMNRLPISYFDKHPNGNLMSIAVNDLDNIATALQSGVTEFISSIILFVGVIVIMFSISWQLTLLAGIMIPISLLIMKVLTPHTQRNNKKFMHLQGNLNNKIEESYQGFTVVKNFNTEASELEKFEKTNVEMIESGWRAQFFGGSMMPSLMFVQNIIYVVLAVFGGLKVISGNLTIGNMQAFLQYSGQFARPLTQFGQIWNSLLSAVASAERVFEVLDAEEMTVYETEFKNNATEQGQVIFDEVTFGYDGNPLMEEFNLTVENGETIAIVGHTGAGKSTFIHLLERFYEIQEGGIRIDGMDIRNHSQHKLRKKLGMVLQDTWLFSGTIFENIQYGNPNASVEEVYAAANSAYAAEFIQKLPDGYQTVLNEEASNISQGQKQLITIARAFVSNPEILILDEATSNVDSRTELLIQQAMKGLMNGRTSFIVAHRLSTIYDAHRILVMDNGAIIESGSHQELIDFEGEYAEIYQSQFAQKTT